MTRLTADSDPRAFIDGWVRDAALATLVAAFGGPPLDPARPTAELFGALESFSIVWDRRGGKERNLATAEALDAAQSEVVHDATRALGLRDTAPPVRAHYDHVLILGGLTRGCLARPLTAAELLGSGALTTGTVTALGAFRPVNDGERTMLADFALADAETEFDVMDFGLRRAFGVDAPPQVDGESGDETARWQVHDYPSVDPPLQVIAAPSREPGRRANTGDTYVWFAERRGQLSPGQSLLIVTTYHYRLYQLADAIRLLGLPYGVERDAVGMMPGAVDARLAWEASPTALLQELRSSIRALRTLHTALPS